ncbi:MAG: tetratricopeptide repeat protein [Thermoplasmata archaeon]
MSESCIVCESEITSIQLICDECADVLFTENIFWIAADPVIGGPVIDRFRDRSQGVLAIGEHPDGELIYKDGETVIQEIAELSQGLKDDRIEYKDAFRKLRNMLAELGVSDGMENCLFSPSDLKIMNDIFYMVEEFLGKNPSVQGDPDFYIAIARLLEYDADKADRPVFSPKFRKKICYDLRKEAERYYDMAVEENNAHCFLSKGKLLLQMGETKEARDNFEKALIIDDKNLDTNIHYVKALLLEDELEIAEQALKELLDVGEENAVVWYLKGEEMRKTGRWGGALQFYDLAINKDEELTEAHLMKGRVLLENNMVEEAYEVLDSALESNSDSESIWYWMSKALHTMGRWGGAIQCLNEALDLEPHFTDAWMFKGDILAERDLYEEAMETYETALKIEPELKQVLEKKKVYKSCSP